MSSIQFTTCSQCPDKRYRNRRTAYAASRAKVTQERQENRFKPESPGTNGTQKMGGTSKSKIAESSWNGDHWIQWDKEEIFCKAGNGIALKLEEWIFIRTVEEIVNQPSLDVSSIWLCGWSADRALFCDTRADLDSKCVQKPERTISVPGVTPTHN